MKKEKESKALLETRKWKRSVAKGTKSFSRKKLLSFYNRTVAAKAKKAA